MSRRGVCVFICFGAILCLNVAVGNAIDVDCFKDSANLACVDFTHSPVEELNDICQRKPYLSACGVKDGCLSKGVCNALDLMANICEHDFHYNDPKCARFKNLCSTTSVVKQCKNHPGLTYLPKTTDVNWKLWAMCWNLPSGGCGMCKKDWEDGFALPVNCDLLKTYSSACMIKGQTGTDNCELWRNMCKVARFETAALCYPPKEDPEEKFLA